MSTSLAAPPRGRTRSAWVIPLVVAVITAVAFLPALQAGFVSWDDDKNFLNNPAFRGLGAPQLRWMWSTFHLGHYVPLSWMSLGLDYLLWGLDPRGYHLTNILLHAIGAVLCFAVVHRLLMSIAGGAGEDASIGGEHPGRAAFDLRLAAGVAALLFAIHPLRVESVAWVTERRDVLSGLFGLASVYCYLRSATDRTPSPGWYRASLGLFLFALLSKATVVTIPALLFVANVFPLRRIGGVAGWWNADTRRIYFGLVPFALLSAAASALTFVALQPVPQLSWSGKLAVSAYGLAFYLGKTIAPVGLAPLYAMPTAVDPMAAVYVGSAALVIAITGTTWTLRRRWPALLAGWLGFVIALLPMLGIHQNGPQLAADRYTYHAAPVLSALAGGVLLAGLRARRSPTLVASALLLVILSVLTWRQSRIWHDSESLWSRVIAVGKGGPIAHNNWGNLLAERGRPAEAEAEYRRAIAIAPTYSEALNNLGVALSRRGQAAEAIPHFERALEVDTAYVDAQVNLGAALAQLGEFASAIAHYQRAIALDPGKANAQVNWGNALVRLQRPAEALEHYREAVRINAGNADAHANWGVALAVLGRFDEAIPHFETALRLDPSHTRAKNAFAEALKRRAELAAP